MRTQARNFTSADVLTAASKILHRRPTVERLRSQVGVAAVGGGHLHHLHHLRGVLTACLVAALRKGTSVL